MTANSSNKKQPTVIPIILAGGSGSRLWPLSRESHPKQLIELADHESLLKKTYARALSFENVTEMITVTNRDLFFSIKDEYETLENSDCGHHFILEPFGRNSAPAITLAAQQISASYGDNTLMLVLPADHLIQKDAAFQEAVRQAISLAETDKLVTFGIKPDGPKTGYGYIEANGHEVIRFIEKPSVKKAQSYIKSGNFFWNSGMFCFKVSTLLSEMKQHCGKLASQAKPCLQHAKVSNGEAWSQTEIRSEDFSNMENISIDYAVFEKSKHVAIVPCDIGWSDIGSWTEFGQLHPKDANENHVYGPSILKNVKNCIIHSENRLVAGLGLENLVIADTADALLVANRERIQEVRAIVTQLKETHQEAYKTFPTVHRPWGNYTVLQEGEGFKLKRIEVKPGATLSLQSHNHRSEHWVVVSGIAKVTNGRETFELIHNQSTYIPIGNKHRLENPNKDTLVLIEVQCGTYLGEDDIIRYDDVYGRITEVAC